MAGNPTTIIVLGPSPESYYVGYGRRHFVENMSPSFTNHAKTALNISMSRWIRLESVSKNGDWIDYNLATDRFHFNADIDQTIRDHLSGANGKAAAEFVSFPDSEERSYFFVNFQNRGAWYSDLSDYHEQRLTSLQREVPNFDVGITGMLFGKGNTNIICFQAGFMADLDDEIDSEDHPLHKVLSEFSKEEGWCVERGSTLCCYDSQFYFLKFKKSGDNTIHMRWNLPDHIAAKLSELKEIAQKPEEQMALMQEDQMWMQLAQTRMNGQIQLSNMMSQNMQRAGLSILAVATGGTVVEEQRYY
ncbi:hypothetical protein C8J57DRAFT_1570223 [Mycena rebaudengoi]|nr:hypothetical protein C8J57DRAFT_1570223 [Mycena rebaudengoi]